MPTGCCTPNQASARHRTALPIRATDVPNRTVDLLVDEDELSRRRAGLVLPEPPRRGWRRLYATSVVQASEGADLEFLRGVRS